MGRPLDDLALGVGDARPSLSLSLSLSEGSYYIRFRGVLGRFPPQASNNYLKFSGKCNSVKIYIYMNSWLFLTFYRPSGVNKLEAVLRVYLRLLRGIGTDRTFYIPIGHYMHTLAHGCRVVKSRSKDQTIVWISICHLNKDTYTYHCMASLCYTRVPRVFR